MESSSAVYSHVAARDLLCRYTRSHPEVLAKINDLYASILAKMAEVALVGNGIFRARAMRDYMVEQAKAMAKICADPDLPHLEDFTLRYLQHKLLKNTKCETIEEYLNESNSVQMTHDFLERIEFLAAKGLQTRDEKAAEWKQIREISRAQWVERMKSLIPFDNLPKPKQDIYLQAMEVVSPPETYLPATLRPATKTGELFNEFRFNGMRFAFFMELLTGKDLVLDMPQHHVFIVAPIQGKEPCKINAAAVYILNDLPERSFVKGAGEVVIFAHKENYFRKYSVEGRPVHSIEGAEVPKIVDIIAATLRSGIKEFSQRAYASDPKDFFQVLNIIGLQIVKATPFEQVREKLNLPPGMTKDEFLASNLDVLQFLNAFFQHRK